MNSNLSALKSPWHMPHHQFADFSHSSVFLFADHNSKKSLAYTMSPESKKEETPQVLPRSQASQVSATRSLYSSYLTLNLMSSNFYSHYSICCYLFFNTKMLISAFYSANFAILLVYIFSVLYPSLVSNASTCVIFSSISLSCLETFHICT